jgi:hypothetical protein
MIKANTARFAQSQLDMLVFLTIDFYLLPRQLTITALDSKTRRAKCVRFPSFIAQSPSEIVQIKPTGA